MNVRIFNKLCRTNPLWLQLTAKELANAKEGILHPCNREGKNGWALEEEQKNIILSYYGKIGNLKKAKVIKINKETR